MEKSNLIKKIERNLSFVKEVFIAEGIIPSIECVIRIAGASIFGMSHRGHPRVNIALNRMTDFFYDLFNGVDTGGMIDLPEMEGCGKSYVGTPPRAWKLLFRYININYNDFTYIDFGCGKGRTMILASQKGFGDIVGVDISPRLLKIAENNLELKSINNKLFCLDVREYDYPNENIVLFMYNPFYPDVMLHIAESIKKSLITNPRELYVVYYSAAFREIWKDLGFTVVKETNYPYPNYVIFYANSFAAQPVASNNECLF